MADVPFALVQLMDEKAAPSTPEPLLLARELLKKFDVWCPPDLVPPFLKDVLRFSRRAVSDLASPRGDQVRPALTWLRIDSHRGGSSRQGGQYGQTLTQQILQLPGAVREQLKHGTRRLVLDWSHEGRPVQGDRTLSAPLQASGSGRSSRVSKAG